MQPQSTTISLSEIHPPADLAKRIGDHVDLARQRRATLLGGFAIFMALNILPAMWLAIDGLNHSGFWDFSALLFSDSSAILSSWRELLSVLAETMPMFPLAAALLAATAALTAGRMATQQAPPSSHHHSLPAGLIA